MKVVKRVLGPEIFIKTGPWTTLSHVAESELDHFLPSPSDVLQEHGIIPTESAALPYMT